MLFFVMPQPFVSPHHEVERPRPIHHRVASLAFSCLSIVPFLFRDEVKQGKTRKRKLDNQAEICVLRLVEVNHSAWLFCAVKRVLGRSNSRRKDRSRQSQMLTIFSRCCRAVVGDERREEKRGREKEVKPQTFRRKISPNSRPIKKKSTLVRRKKRRARKKI